MEPINTTLLFSEIMYLGTQRIYSIGKMGGSVILVPNLEKSLDFRNHKRITGTNILVGMKPKIVEDLQENIGRI